MNTEALTELILKRVMEHLSGAQPQDKEIPAPAASQSVLVLGDNFDPACLGSGFAVTYLKDSAQASAADFNHIVVADLPNKLLGEMVMGLERGGEGCVIVESLLLGKTVYVLEEGIAYRRFRDTAKPAFYKLFQDKEQTLVSYGMEVVPQGQLASVLAGTECQACQAAPVAQPVQPAPLPTAKPKVVNTESYTVDKRVISESDLRQGVDKGFTRFIIKAKALLTPLAGDYIRVKSLEVDRV